jgi:hypothetical protein
MRPVEWPIYPQLRSYTRKCGQPFSGVVDVAFEPGFSDLVGIIGEARHMPENSSTREFYACRKSHLPDVSRPPVGVR